MQVDWKKLGKIMKQLILIAALDAQNGIGKDGDMAWACKADLRHFREQTTGHPVIMGRKTFDSIGAPLANRVNLVVTRNTNDIDRDGYMVGRMTSLREAIEVGHLFDDKVYVIGGGEIYQQAMPLATHLVLTHIDKVFDCDTKFPQIDPMQWRLTHTEPVVSGELGCQITFSFYERAV